MKSEPVIQSILNTSRHREGLKCKQMNNPIPILLRLYIFKYMPLSCK